MMIGNKRGNIVVGSVAGIVREVAEIVKMWVKTAEPRRMRKAIDYGERFIRRAHEVYDITDKDLKKWEEKFFDKNN